MPAAPRKHAAKTPSGPTPPQAPHVALAEQYAAGVLTGEVPACKWVKLAVERQARDLQRRDWRYVFDVERAEKVCRFIETQPHIKGKWARERLPLRLEPWQCWKTTTLFGWVDRDTGMRRFRRALLLEPRKNAKSTWAAAIGNYMLVADNEHGAEVYTGATSEKQAWEVFGVAQAMVRGRPLMQKHFGIEVNASNINVLATASKFEPVIGNPGDGASASCSIVDEYHEHKTSALYDTMITGMGAREQPLLLAITTAGDNIAGPCYDAVISLRKVLEGTEEDEELFGIEFTIDPEDDWTSPDVLRKANPNFGVSVSAEFLLARQADAIRNTRAQGPFKTKHLNLWVNSRSAYFNMEKWRRCARGPEIDAIPEGTACYMGLDLASFLDIAAVELLFDMEDGTFARHGLHYLPEATVMDPKNSLYRAWVEDGTIIMTEGDMIDFARIQEDIEQICSRFRVQIGYDPYQATMLITQLQNAGIEVTEYRNVVTTMSEPMKQLDALIASEKLLHTCGERHPMTWQMSNVVARPDAKDNVFPRKERPELKIDGPVALIMAVGRQIAAASSGAGDVPEIRVW